MIKEVIVAGGPGLLVPAVLFALAIYAVRGLFGLHSRRSQHRKEFLEHWDRQRIDDDLWLEVTIRHLYGQTLPSHVIRTALTHPHSSQALLDLSELWPFFAYDPDTKRVCWAYARHRLQATRRLGQYWPFIRYLLCALGSMAAAICATQSQGLTQWVYAFLAMTLAIGAFFSLWYGESEKTAAIAGEAWIHRINSSAPQDSTTAEGFASDSDS